MSDALEENVYEIIVLVIKAWFFMLLIGSIHSHYSEVPPIGYGVSLMVVGVARILVDWQRYADVK